MKHSNIAWLLASAYGVSPYSAGSYSQNGLQIGPVTLPVTGAQGLLVLGVIAIAVGAGLFVWANQKRRRGGSQTG